MIYLFVGLAVLFFIYLLYTGQFKWLFGVLRNMAVGMIAILLVNMGLSALGVYMLVGVNMLTVAIVGLLGIPGFILLYGARLIL